MDCTSLLIHQALSDGYFADWHVDSCELVEVENHKNEARFKSADGNLYYVGGGKLAVAVCLLPQYLFSVLYFILHAARPRGLLYLLFT